MAEVVRTRNVASQPMSELALQATVLPQSARWPDHKTKGWEALRVARDDLRGLVGNVDQQCCAIENNQDYKSDAIGRLRNDLGTKAIGELENWPPLIASEKLVAAEIAAIDASMAAMPRPPKGDEMVLAVATAAFIRSQKDPGMWVQGHGMSDPNVLQAVLHLPPFHTGLTQTQVDGIRNKARMTLHPEAAQRQDQLKNALAETRDSVEKTKGILRKRCPPAIRAPERPKPVLQGKNLTELGQLMKRSVSDDDVEKELRNL